MYRSKGEHELGIAAARKAVECAPDASFYLAFLGEAYAAAETLDEEQKVLAQLRERSKQQYVTTYHMGRIYASIEGVGDRIVSKSAIAIFRQSSFLNAGNSPAFIDLPVSAT